MLQIDASALARLLEPHQLIARLEQAFRAGAVVPQRPHYSIPVDCAPEGSLILMPAWRAGGHIGLKVVTVFGGNADRGLPTVQAAVLLLDASTGALLALLDGTELTLRRTAAASALAAKYLAREDARRLLMVGTGRLAPHVIAAHANVRPLEEVRVWGRNVEKARRVVQRLDASTFRASATENLAAAVGWADIISCATTATDPLIAGRELRPGQHVDLIGSYTRAMREADTEAVQRAEVFVDTYAGALAESGELLQALDAGAITRDDIRGELSELVRGAAPGRSGPQAITLFKSVGTALEDLAAAELAVSAMGG